MTRALLDVNVLLALLDVDHVDHGPARRWLESEVDQGWASCAITQNGFVRIISQSRYPSPVPPGQALERLGRAVATPWHQFWPCSLSLLEPDAIDRSQLHGSSQVTDAYLLALAVHHHGRLATFDRSVPLSAVPGAGPEHISVIGTS